jgi:predicted phage-related endonuclease
MGGPVPKRRVVIEYEGTVELSEEGVKALEDWEEIQRQKAKLKEPEDAAVEKIKTELAAADAEAGTVDGKVRIVWTKGTQKRLDTTRMRAELGDEALAAYMKESERREFRPPAKGDQA